MLSSWEPVELSPSDRQLSSVSSSSVSSKERLLSVLKIEETTVIYMHIIYSISSY